jgi:rod shape-determining protein MreC
MDVPANTAVVTSSGLVGKIVSKNGNFAICQNLIDPNSRISVRIQRNRELGIVSWDGGENLLLNNIPNTVTVQKGDVLYTSGMSLIYPPHIKVGVVQSVSKNNGQLFQTIYVKPAVNFKRIEEVFIVKGKIINES